MPETSPRKIPCDPAHHIRQIFIEESCADLAYVHEICERAQLPTQIIADRSDPPVAYGSFPKNLQIGKQHLVLSKNRGCFFKPCPGTREYRCCDYHVLNIGMGCPMDCVYCILQAYLNKPWLTFFVNSHDLFAELDLAFKRTSQFWRIGTGEFTDSLAIDHITRLSPLLINYMRDKTKGVLELKTKSVSIQHLANLDHNGRTVIAWSLNAPAIMTKEELHTASLDERLAAACQVADMGYKLAFHFDPIIYHDGWQEGYSATIKKLFATVPAEKIAWISLGALRFLPQLKAIALTRFPGSTFFHEEFILGLDNKYRYFRALRVEMYKHLLNEMRALASPHTCLYFCMESDEIWQECGFTPGKSQSLPDDLDTAFTRTA
ncbi:MAG: DNA photolyase [Proteobacteria bacterium]|nr:DNA photolyase [Pseudomonadota bacterium]MBU1641260.1 DNA photolyase [Pseudomonadota bacterium]